jgi:hypothetical protein
MGLECTPPQPAADEPVKRWRLGSAHASLPGGAQRETRQSILFEQSPMRWMRGSCPRTTRGESVASYLNLLLRGNPFGANRPASARLPRQSASSFMVSEKVRSEASFQVSPSAALKVFTSESPPSL